MEFFSLFNASDGYLGAKNLVKFLDRNQEKSLDFQQSFKQITGLKYIPIEELT